MTIFLYPYTDLVWGGGVNTLEMVMSTEPSLEDEKISYQVIKFKICFATRWKYASFGAKYMLRPCMEFYIQQLAPSVGWQLLTVRVCSLLVLPTAYCQFCDGFKFILHVACKYMYMTKTCKSTWFQWKLKTPTQPRYRSLDQRYDNFISSYMWHAFH